MSRWLITGAAGFLGTNAGLWLGGRATRIGLSRSGPSAMVFDEFIDVDLRDHQAAADLIREARPDVVLHGAAIAGHETCSNDPEQAVSVNVTASRFVSQAAADVGARMIYISTDAVFDGRRGGYRENDEPSPFSVYGETKLAGEQEALAANADTLVVRTNFFGWSVPGKRSVLEFFVDSLRQRQSINGYPDFVVTSIYVRSLIEALWRLNEAGTTGVIHATSSDALSKYDFGLTVAEVFGLDADLIAPLAWTGGDHTTSRSRNISLNTDRLAGILGAPPQSQADGVRQAYDEEAAVRPVVRGDAG